MGIPFGTYGGASTSILLSVNLIDWSQHRCFCVEIHTATICNPVSEIRMEKKKSSLHERLKVSASFSECFGQPSFLISSHGASNSSHQLLHLFLLSRSQNSGPFMGKFLNALDHWFSLGGKRLFLTKSQFYFNRYSTKMVIMFQFLFCRYIISQIHFL